MDEPSGYEVKYAPGRKDYPDAPASGTGDEVLAVESLAAIYRENLEALYAIASADRKRDES